MDEDFECTEAAMAQLKWQQYTASVLGGRNDKFQRQALSILGIRSIAAYYFLTHFHNEVRHDMAHEGRRLMDTGEGLRGVCELLKYRQKGKFPGCSSKELHAMPLGLPRMLSCL